MTIASSWKVEGLSQGGGGWGGDSGGGGGGGGGVGGCPAFVT